MANVCPIFNEEKAFIGCWALNKNFEPSQGSLAELASLAKPTLKAFSMNPPRRVNNRSVDVGNGVRFERGVFLMIKDEPAPNEELERSDENAYALIDQLGIACLIRCARSDTRINKPPQTQPDANCSTVQKTRSLTVETKRQGAITINASEELCRQCEKANDSFDPNSWDHGKGEYARKILQMAGIVMIRVWHEKKGRYNELQRIGEGDISSNTYDNYKDERGDLHMIIRRVQSEDPHDFPFELIAVKRDDWEELVNKGFFLDRAPKEQKTTAIEDKKVLAQDATVEDKDNMSTGNKPLIQKKWWQFWR